MSGDDVKCITLSGGHGESDDDSIAVGIHCHLSSEPSREFKARIMINIKQPNSRHLDISAYEDNPFDSFCRY